MNGKKTLSLTYIIIFFSCVLSCCAFRPKEVSVVQPIIVNEYVYVDTTPASLPESFPEDEGWTGEQIKQDGGYFSAETDGLFYPEDDFTRSDAARTFYALLEDKPSGEVFLKDVTTKAKCYKAASALAEAGYMALDENERFYPDVAITREDFSSLLKHLFLPSKVESALSNVDFPLSRGEAAQIINNLAGLESSSDSPYFADVAPDYQYYNAIEIAGYGGTEDRYAPGFINIDGYLYYVDENSFFLRNGSVGSLYFANNCRYTSGDEALDIFVAQTIDAQTRSSQSKEEKLRTVYEYVRDNFLYLKRNLYEVGKTGWETSDALILFQTGKGNCYNFTGAFWALARGLGYDAKAYAGLVGVGRDPHSWTEIPWDDGNTYIFDVETEMSYRLMDDYITSMYKITYETGEKWSYVRTPEE